MERHLANSIAERIIYLISGDKSLKNILAYGFELIITSCLGVLMLIVCSIVSGVPVGWIPFLLGFAPLRTVAGGFHATTHNRCYLVTTSIYYLCISICKHVAYSPLYLILLAIMVYFIVFIFAPLAAKNKPLAEGTRSTNRCLSIMLSLVLVFFSVILCLIRYSDFYIALVFLGAAAASGSIVMAKIIDFLERRISSND